MSLVTGSGGAVTLSPKLAAGGQGEVGSDAAYLWNLSQLHLK